MAGSIRQRGKSSWQLTVYVGYDSKARKRRYASKTVRGTKREAELALAEFVTEVAKGGRVATGPISVEQVLTKWLDARKAQLSPSTTDRYRVAIKLIPASLKKLSVARLRAHHIEDLYVDLVAAGQSGSSIRKLHWALRQSMAWAHKRGFTGLIATVGVDLPPLAAKMINPPPSADVRKVVEHLLATDPDWGTLVAVVAWTGCRRGEVCALRWEDIDITGKSILIHRSVVAVPGGVEERGTKTGQQRRLAIGPRTVKLLRAHQKRCRERAKACDATLEATAFVFSPEAAGRRPYNPHTITRVFVAACDGAEVRRMRLHDLRHHSATTLLKQGAALGEVMDRHGWKTVEMVNRYRHLLEAKDVKAAKGLENA
ncbi:MAG: tyrosine-type recombinase/integrase [Acidimicrobiales bacterium]|jgi:integrase